MTKQITSEDGNSFNYSASSVSALKATVEKNLMNLAKVELASEIPDATYKQLGGACEVDFRTIKKWILGETKTLGVAPYNKIRNFINKSTLFHIYEPAILFDWIREPGITHIIFDYDWGNEEFSPNKSKFQLTRNALKESLRGFSEDKFNLDKLDLLEKYEGKSFDLFLDWEKLGINVSAANLPIYRYPDELIDKDQHYKVVLFSISITGEPKQIIEPIWEDVEPL